MTSSSHSIHSVLNLISNSFKGELPPKSPNEILKILTGYKDHVQMKQVLMNGANWPTGNNWPGNRSWHDFLRSTHNVQFTGNEWHIPRVGGPSGGGGSSFPKDSAMAGVVGTAASSVFGKVRTLGRTDRTLTDKLGLLDLGETAAKSISSALFGPAFGKIEEEVGKKLKGILGDTFRGILGKIGKEAEAIIGSLDQVLDKIIAHAVSVTAKYDDLRYETLMHAQKTNGDFLDLLSKMQDQEMTSMGITRFETLKEFIESSEKLSLRYRKNSTENAYQFSKTAMILRRFDVQNAAEMFEIMSSGFGKGIKEFNDLTNRSIGFAQKSGISNRKYFEDLAKFSEQFASELDFTRVEGTFKNLTMHARNLNIETGTLLSSMEQFDDAQAMQDVGGKLNAILSSFGSHFDSLHMTTLDLEERLPYLMQQLRSAQPGISSLGKNEQRMMMKQLGAITSQMGVDQSSLRKIMNADKDSIASISEKLKRKKYEDFSLSGPAGEIADELKAMIRDTPKDWERMRDDAVPSSLIATLSSNQKILHESDSAVWNAFNKYFEQIYGKAGKVGAAESFGAARDRSLAASSEAPDKAIENTIKAMGSLLHNLKQSFEKKEDAKDYHDVMGGHSAPESKVRKGEKLESLTMFSPVIKGFDDSGKRFAEAASMVLDAAKRLQNMKITIESKGDKRTAFAVLAGGTVA